MQDLLSSVTTQESEMIFEMSDENDFDIIPVAKLVEDI
jgi:hypothetical protein